MPSGAHYNLVARFAKVLAQGDFIPSRPGELGHGYDLYATHPNGDVVLRCGGNAGWFDWFTPVRTGERPGFEVAIDGTRYRLVRGLDALPCGFARLNAGLERGTLNRGPGRPAGLLEPRRAM